MSQQSNREETPVTDPILVMPLYHGDKTKVSIYPNYTKKLHVGSSETWNCNMHNRGT